MDEPTIIRMKQTVEAFLDGRASRILVGQLQRSLEGLAGEDDLSRVLQKIRSTVTLFIDPTVAEDLHRRLCDDADIGNATVRIAPRR